MEGMATGCTEDETCIEITAGRGYREEGKRKVRKLSSLKRTKMDERKLKVSWRSRQRNGRKEVDRGKHRWNSCGSEAGKGERKQTEAKYESHEELHEKSGRMKWGRHRIWKEEMSTGQFTVRWSREETERKKQKLSSEVLKRKRTKESGSQGSALKEKSKGITWSTAVGVSQGRAKGNKQKAKYRNLEERHERSGLEDKRKTPRRKLSRALVEPLWGNTSKNGTEETEDWVARSEWNTDERKWTWSRKSRKRKHKGITCRSAVGEKQDRAKENKQKAKYRNLEERHDKSGLEERGKRQDESWVARWWSHC